MKRRRVIRTGQKTSLRAALPYVGVIIAMLLVALNLWLNQQNALLARQINLLDRVASTRVATLQLLKDKYNGHEQIAYEQIWDLDDGAWAMLELTEGSSPSYYALAKLDKNLVPRQRYTSVNGLKATHVVKMVDDGERIWALHGAENGVGLGVSRYDALSDAFVPMGASSGLASENVSSIVPSEGLTFALYAEPAMGVGIYHSGKDRWLNWQPLEDSVQGDVVALNFTEDKFFALSGPSGATAEISGMSVLSPRGVLLAQIDLTEPGDLVAPRLKSLGLTQRGMFLDLETSEPGGAPLEITRRIDLNTLAMDEFTIDGEDEAFVPVSRLPFYNWGNIALFIGEDGAVAALDEHTGEFGVLDGLNLFEDVSNIWHHQGELWVSSHHSRGLLPGQWKLCRYDADRHASAEFGVTPGLFGTVLKSGGGVRVRDVVSRGAEMWLALDRGLYKRVRRHADEDSEWFVMLKKNQRPVLASELQFMGDRLLLRTASGWQSLQLESESGNRLIACANPFGSPDKL